MPSTKETIHERIRRAIALLSAKQANDKVDAALDVLRDTVNRRLAEVPGMKEVVMEMARRTDEQHATAGGASAAAADDDGSGAGAHGASASSMQIETGPGSAGAASAWMHDFDHLTVLPSPRHVVAAAATAADGGDSAAPAPAPLAAAGASNSSEAAGQADGTGAGAGAGAEPDAAATTTTASPPSSMTQRIADCGWFWWDPECRDALYSLVSSFNAWCNEENSWRGTIGKKMRKEMGLSENATKPLDAAAEIRTRLYMRILLLFPSGAITGRGLRQIIDVEMARPRSQPLPAAAGAAAGGDAAAAVNAGGSAASPSSAAAGGGGGAEVSPASAGDGDGGGYGNAGIGGDGGDGSAGGRDLDHDMQAEGDIGNGTGPTIYPIAEAWRGFDLFDIQSISFQKWTCGPCAAKLTGGLVTPAPPPAATTSAAAANGRGGAAGTAGGGGRKSGGAGRKNATTANGTTAPSARPSAAAVIAGTVRRASEPRPLLPSPPSSATRDAYTHSPGDGAGHAADTGASGSFNTAWRDAGSNDGAAERMLGASSTSASHGVDRSGAASTSSSKFTSSTLPEGPGWTGYGPDAYSLAQRDDQHHHSSSSAAMHTETTSTMEDADDADGGGAHPSSLGSSLSSAGAAAPDEPTQLPHAIPAASSSSVAAAVPAPPKPSRRRKTPTSDLDDAMQQGDGAGARASAVGAAPAAPRPAQIPLVVRAPTGKATAASRAGAHGTGASGIAVGIVKPSPRQPPQPSSSGGIDHDGNLGNGAGTSEGSAAPVADAKQSIDSVDSDVIVIE